MQKFFGIIPLCLMLIALGCGKRNASNLPDGVTWTSPEYSNLFQFGYLKNDSFLAIRNPTDTQSWMQVFHWGTKNSFPGCTTLKSRNRIASMSAVFSAMLEAIEEESRIICTDDTRFHTMPRCRKRIAKGLISSIGSGNVLNKEKLAGQKPDLVIAYFIDQQGKDEWTNFTKTGTPVLFCQNYLETHPLGRAEWIRAMGWLLGKPAQADAFFTMVKEHYQELQASIKEQVKIKPTVFCNLPYSGTWDLPSGGSYMATLFEDAGSDYLWNNTKGSGKITSEIESVFKKAKEADYWINPGACKDIRCITQTDQRLGLFRALKENGVYNATKISTPEGGNAWWDYAVIRPDLVLQDLAGIFHPDLETASTHSFTFFEQVK